MEICGHSHRVPALLSYGYFVVSIFHNIANQIMQLQCELQKAAPDLPLHTYRELQRQLNYISQVVRHSQEILTREEPQWQTFGLRECLWQTRCLCSLMLTRQQIRCRITCSADLQLRADPVIPQQILLNLIHNSVQALEEISPDERQLDIVAVQQGKGIIIAFTDRGPGLRQLQVNQVGEPFSTYRPDHQVHGLGLAYVRHHMHHSFGGECQLLSQPGKGTTIRLFLPNNSTSPNKSTAMAVFP